MAAKVALIDRIFTVYGAEAAQARAQFRDLEEGAIHQIWPEGRNQAATLAPNIQAGNALFLAIQELSPKDEAQRALKAQLVSMVVELGQLRTLLLVQSTPSISKPMLVVVVSWLVVI